MSRTAIILLLVWAVTSCCAQQNRAAQPVLAPPPGTSAPPTRPRIGVALEGGGALGFAHIGVLRWFEEHHIPIDYIAGTSMGGLIAGLYATGKTPRQMEEFVREQDWDTIIGGRIPYEDLSYRRKEDVRAFQNSIVLGLKHGLATAPGLNAGHAVSMVIDRETLPYSNVTSFDDLPIPFRCVATDLVSGKEVVFSQGSLQTALRATMSIPGLFSPVRDGDKLYVDGGLTGNLPTDVVRKMGADIVIAVHLDTAPADPQQIQSLFGVLGRSIDVVIRDNEIRGMKGADLIVDVDLRSYSSMDYSKGGSIVQFGTEAAEAKARVLSPYSVDEPSWRQYIEARSSRERRNTAVPQFVAVKGTSPNAARNLEKFLQPLVGKPINDARLDQYLTRLTGIGKFDSADYALAHRDGQDGLTITVHEKSYAPPILQFGFSVDGSESDDVTYTLLTRLTLMDVAGYRSEWRTDAQFGNTYSISSELYRPVTATSRWFLAPHADAGSTGLKLFTKNDPRADYRLYSAHIGGDI
jgi:NTE family protein